MNLGYIQESSESDRRPATAEEIKARTQEYQLWRELLAMPLSPFTIRVETRGGSGYRTALCYGVDVIRRQRYAWHPVPVEVLCQAW